MRRLLNGSLGVALTLAGCQAGTPTRSGSPAITSPAPGAKPGPAGIATPGPVQTPSSVAASATTPTAPLKLDPPPAGSARLAGQVRLDAAYALRAGAGAALIGLDGSTLIGMDGSTLQGDQLRDRTGQVVAADGARFAVPAGLIGLDGSTLIGNDGSTLIGLDGSTLIGNDGSTLIGNDGSTLVGKAGASLRNGSTYRLAQAAASGGSMPAAGMWVSVVDIRTGFTVALGTAGGKPVYTLYTDARGGFEAHVPADVAPFARVVARPPGRRDPGLVVNQLVRSVPAGQELAIDAEAVGATSFLRAILSARLAGAMAVKPEDAAAAFAGFETGGKSRGGPLLDALLRASGGSTFLSEVQKAYLSVAGANPSDVVRHELPPLMADRIFATLDLNELKLNGALMSSRSGSPELEGRPVLPELRGVFRRIREAARAQLAGQADPVAYYAAKPYMQAYNLRQPPAQRARIEQAEDLVAFVVRAYLVQNDDNEYERVHDVLHDLYQDLPAAYREGRDPQALELDDRDRLRMAGADFVMAIILKGAEEANDPAQSLSAQVAKLIQQAGTRLAAVPVPPARPAPSPPSVPALPPAEPAWEVTTVAGAAGVADVTDGPGATARFNKPRGMWIDPAADPPIVFVADAHNGLIRKLTFDQAGSATVTTVAGTVLPDPKTGKPIGARLAQDGPPGVGCFVEPADLAFAPDGKLYVVDSGMNALRRVNLDKGAANADIETIASKLDAEQPFSDGPGRDVRFKYPVGLLLEADGHALVTDTLHFAVRRVGLSAPYPVTTLLGANRPVNLDGPLRKADGSPGALQDSPFDAARAPDGAIWLCEGGSAPIRRIDPDGRSVRTIAGGSVPQKDAIDEPALGRIARFDGPWAIAVSAVGDAIVADTVNHRIRRVRPDGWVTTIAGGGPVGEQAGSWADGPGREARFKFPRGVAVAPDGSIFVADDNNTIRRIRKR